MSSLSRICFGLAGFLLVAGTVYGLTSHEAGGTTLLLVLAATLCFVGVVCRRVARKEAGEEPGGEPEVHVGPTIWPFGFAIAALIIALGLVVSSWLLIAGALVFVLSAAGWLRDVARGRAHANEA